ncbi:MBL fold metallo-hydrolase [Pseudactinotalea terrae]|uniref:MBL fold metallo-hydrolase n=1 Tax=Pseudactinotalea terrae TaxID=1743262 RepID=UPI0012E0EEA0|nr:MBL fold metallo-hydrolase [Pseudactinotalea terrae]
MERFTHIAGDVHLLKVPFTGVWTGVTLVLSDDAPILVDSGGMSETVDSTIVPALAEMGLSLADIGWVLATHIHGDHVGGIARMRELAPSIKVGVLRESDGRMRDPLAYSREIRAKFPEHSAAPPPVLDGVAPDLLLDDGAMVGPLRVIHTPGHDTDACCFFDTRSGTLITGDSLQLNGTISQGCALLFDPQRYLGSLQRLLAMPIQNIICGHPYLPHGEVAIGEHAARQLLAAAIGCYEHDRGFVTGMAAAGTDDVLAIAQALVASVGGVEPQKLFLPMHTVAAYLKAARDERDDR